MKKFLTRTIRDSILGILPEYLSDLYNNLKLKIKEQIKLSHANI